MKKIAKQLFGMLETNESYKMPTQKELKKLLPGIFKHIKAADIVIKIQIDQGIFTMPNQKTFREESGPDGNSTITFHLYHKDRDKRKEAIKRATK